MKKSKIIKIDYFAYIEVVLLFSLEYLTTLNSKLFVLSKPFTLNLILKNLCQELALQLYWNHHFLWSKRDHLVIFFPCI